MSLDPKKQKILIWLVDDHPYVRRNFEENFNCEDMEAKVFATPDEVIKELQRVRAKAEKPPDALLCDIFFYPKEEDSIEIEKKVQEEAERIRTLGLEIEEAIIRKNQGLWEHKDIVGGITLAEKVRNDIYGGDPPFPIFAYTSKGPFLLETEDFDKIQKLKMRWLLKKVISEKLNEEDKKAYNRILKRAIEMGIEESGLAATHARMIFSMLSAFEEISPSKFCIFGRYVRYEESTRVYLTGAMESIEESLQDEGNDVHRNFLIWGPPGEGKSYFVQELYKELKKRINHLEYYPLDLSNPKKRDFTSAFSRMSKSEAAVCFIDEIDSDPTNWSWNPYGILRQHMTLASHVPIVFLMAGSTPSSVEDMKKKIISYPKGADMLDRVPPGNEYSIPPATARDRVVITAANFKWIGQKKNKEIKNVEKLALYYIALNPLIRSTRQLTDFAAATVNRMRRSTFVRYDDLFDSGDPKRDQFLNDYPLSGQLKNHFIRVIK